MPLELIATAPRTPELREYEDGPVPDGQVRVQVEFGAPKHGTEMTEYRANRGSRFPRGLGNMCVGRIVEIGGGAEGFEIGERVAGYGSLRETHTWRVGSVLKMSERMTWKEAVCYDPAHFALGGVRDGNARAGDHVAVFGLGALGQMSAQFARLSGADAVSVIDPIEARRQVALNAGADFAFDADPEAAVSGLKEVSGGRGPDLIIETSANYRALDTALRALAYGGTVAYMGWPKECEGGLDFGAKAHFEVPNMIFTRACSEPNRDHPRWNFQRIRETCWRWLNAGTLNCEEIVSPVVPFAEVVEAYRSIDERPELSVKLGVEF